MKGDLYESGSKYVRPSACRDVGCFSNSYDHNGTGELFFSDSGCLNSGFLCLALLPERESDIFWEIILPII